MTTEELAEEIKGRPGQVLSLLIKAHGKEAILEAIHPKPATGGACDNGYHWDNVLRRCVLNAG